MKTIYHGIAYGSFAFIAILVMELIFSLLRIESGLPGKVLPKIVYIALLRLCIFAPIFEEFFFRFLPIRLTQRATTNMYTLYISIILVSVVLFGAIHGSWMNIFFQGLGGFIFALAFLKKGYWGSVIAHSTCNFLIFFSYYIAVTL